MSEDDKERTVNLGCVTWLMLAFLVSGVWGIGTALRHIDEHLMMANCLTEAAHGITCPEAKK